ncbi:hypothetical protein MKX08_003760 [Trichoderma sp. CBMAI-0020]|nr:hypothetical protein MKX08_003760 [Trichoderma sp. CBMAI-0020]
MPPPRKPQTGAASKEENIYIPSFISKRPFYAGEEGDDDNDYLKHQRREEKNEKAQWYVRGKKAGPAATKYRKGACENCGSMTHKAKDCLSRPRAKGAKWTGKDIQADEVVQDVKLGWDAKRDRWNGYDAREYRRVVDDFNEMEELRKQAKNAIAGDDDDEEGKDDGDKYAEENDMSKHQSTATRQLRIREDTAKYLLNLDLESAKYDPKTRALVNSGATADKAADLFAEEGFMRSSGDAGEFEKAQRYAWEAQEKSGDTTQHLQANPTAGAFYRKKQAEEAEERRLERERELLEKYGGDAHKAMPAALRNMAMSESETFVEYDEAGLIKGAPLRGVKSKYAEDVLINNHTSVWGSWWSNFKWGYACCHSFIKNSYCTGEEGKEAWEAAQRQRFEAPVTEREAEPLPKESEEAELGTTLKDASSRKRTQEEMLNGVSEAEMDEYRRKRTVAQDPMANLLGQGEVDVLLGVETDNEGGDIDDLLANTDVALANQDTGVVDGLGKTELVDTGLQAALQEILNLQGQDVIELHARLVENTDTDETSNQGIAFEKSLGVLLVEVLDGLMQIDIDIPGSTTDLGQSQTDSPDLTLVAQAILSNELQLRVPDQK